MIGAAGSGQAPNTGAGRGGWSDAADDVMHEITPGVYRAASGFTAQREDGLTPNGNPVGQRWVLRNASGAWVDVNQYRHDLFEHNGLRTAY